MSIEAALTAFLTSDPDVQNLAGGRVYPLALPQGATFPALTYYVVSVQTMKSFAGLSGSADTVMTVDCWATSYTDAKALGAAVRGNRTTPKLDGFRGKLAGVLIQRCFCTNEIDLHERPVHGDERGVYHKALDFAFWYEDVETIGGIGDTETKPPP